MIGRIQFAVNSAKMTIGICPMTSNSLIEFNIILMKEVGNSRFPYWRPSLSGPFPGIQLYELHCARINLKKT